MTVSHRVSVRYAVKTHLQAALQQCHVREQLCLRSIKPHSVSLSRKVRVKVTEHKASLVNGKSVGCNIWDRDSRGVLTWREHIPAVDAVTFEHLHVGVIQKQVRKGDIAAFNKFRNIKFCANPLYIGESVRLSERPCLHKHAAKSEVNVRPRLSHAHVYAVILHTYGAQFRQVLLKQAVSV